ncbi:MAG: hypothetical protein E6J79_17045 [Deltaproteobacteria bacterium]|nr:MAG: hypothetical protein E6J79_17045 [Deltaproteobacteria bacterium]
MSSRPRPDPARARRVLAVAGAVIAAGQLATGLALDAAPAKVRFAQGARVLEQARALGGARYVLLLGSSRFWELDPATAATVLRETAGAGSPPVLKGAVPAGDPVVADYLLERLLGQGSRPELIALEISPETVCYPTRWAAEHAIRFFTWSDVAAWAPEIALAGQARKVAAARFTPVQLYRRELLTWIAGTAPPYLRVAPPGRLDGTSARRLARPVPRVEDARPPPAPTANGAGVTEPPERMRPNAATLFGLRETRKWLRHYRLDGGAARALEHLLARCQDAGIRVALVGVPVSSWVRELYTSEIERAFGGYMDRVSGRFGTEFVDYRARIPDRFFKDHHHLNRRGADLFVRMLAGEVLAPRWRHREDGS